MLANRPLISVLIVNYNSGHRLVQCLEALKTQTFADFEILILDNASTDHSAEIEFIGSQKLILIKSDHNLGFAVANNRLASLARGTWLAPLNPDAYPKADWLEVLIAATKAYPFARAFGSTQIDALNPAMLDGTGDVYHAFGVPYRGNFGHPVSTTPPDGECFSPCAAAALICKETFLKVGGFAENFFCYGEDVDLGFRMRLAGVRCVQVEKAVVAHEGSAVSGRYSPFTVYHGNRNRIWTYFRNMPLILLILTFPFHLLVNVYLAVRAFTVGIGKPFLHAMRDGYAALPRLMKERRTIQASRIASIADIARALTWSPLKVSRRAQDLKPIRGGY